MRSFSPTSCWRAVMVTRLVGHLLKLHIICLCDIFSWYFSLFSHLSMVRFSLNATLRCSVSTALTAPVSTRAPCTRSRVPRALAIIMRIIIIILKQFPIFSHHQQSISALLTSRPTLSITSRTRSIVWRHRATHPTTWPHHSAAALATDRSHRPIRTWTICKTTRKRMFSISHLRVSCCPRSSTITFNVERLWSGTSRKIDWDCQHRRRFSKIPQHRHSKCAAVHFRFSTCHSIHRRRHRRPSPPSRCSSTCQRIRSFPFYTGSTARVYRTIWTNGSSSRCSTFAVTSRRSIRCSVRARSICDW